MTENTISAGEESRQRLAICCRSCKIFSHCVKSWECLFTKDYAPSFFGPDIAAFFQDPKQKLNSF